MPFPKYKTIMFAALLHQIIAFIAAYFLVQRYNKKIYFATFSFKKIFFCLKKNPANKWREIKP